MMAEGLRAIRAALDANLGRCPRCMRQSFLAALAAWALAAALCLTGAGVMIAFATAGVACAASLIWIGHVSAYGWRRALKPRDDVSLASRRGFALNMLRAAGAMAAVTALPRLASAQDHLHDCLTCCDKNLQSCGNGGDCNVNYQNCVNNCNAQGSLPVTWRCW